MPLRDDLLNPVPGENPSGVSLRYERIYDQIKEARTEEDESIPSGDWQRQSSVRTFALVIKLAGEALATKSKDLQLAAWLTEAHIKREGISASSSPASTHAGPAGAVLGYALSRNRGRRRRMRAVPIEWAANRVAAMLREAPITSAKAQFLSIQTIAFDRL